MLENPTRSSLRCFSSPWENLDEASRDVSPFRIVFRRQCRTRRISLLAFSLVLSILFSSLLMNLAYSSLPFDAGISMTVIPFSVVIKVGERATINVTVTNAKKAATGQICFSLEGFPSSGFRTSFLPECAALQLGKATAILTVEATPAAAPQTVSAFVIARSADQVARASIQVTVEPAFPPWITWAGLLLFFLILGLASMGKPKLDMKKLIRNRPKSLKQSRSLRLSGWSTH